VHVTHLAIALFLAAETQADTDEAALAFFENRVRPVLAENCFGCHGAEKEKGGLRLDSRARALEGSDNGPVIVPGKPEESVLVRAIRHDGETRMPPKGKLKDADVAAIARWIEIGAPWPPNDGSGKDGKADGAPPEARARSHWAFQPAGDVAPPEVRGAAWCRSPVDAFVLARLEAAGLAPSPPAPRRRLLRRLSFDLAGLPPRVEDVEAFETDAAPDAADRAVDRLLASPRYGERWGRHWLDVARYADTTGYLFTQERRFPYSYTYRDYVVRALNEDLPYDRFVVEQLAADQLELGEDKRPLAAMGFLTLGRRFLNNPHDIIDDRIDVVTRGLMGLTVQCARCHDHKYDPIPSADYYSLYGVFASSVEPEEKPLIAAATESTAYEAFSAELKQHQAAVDAFRAQKHAELEAELRAKAGEYLLASARKPERLRSDVGVSVAAGELRPQLVRRWREFLERRAQGADPVFRAWRELAALGPEDFSAQASRLAAEWKEANAGGESINARVIEALAAPSAPVDLADAAKRYGEVLSRADKAWQDLLRAAASGAAQGAQAAEAPKALGDSADEELRQALYGAESPAVVKLEETERLLDRASKDKLRGLQKKVDSLKATHPGAPARAMVLADLPAPAEPRVFVRGKPENPGAPVPRQFLGVLAGKERRPFSRGSGRLELAEAIASAQNPLTARVFANRVWMHQFGRPLVTTPGDFGTRSEPPSHPELLDFLARRFAADGWSIKKLHRLVLLSSAYAQASDLRADGEEVDPENRLLWRQNRRRLEFEPLRDAVLAVAGRLDTVMGGRSVDVFAAPFSTRRTVYGFIDRQNLPGVLRSFDFASPDATTPARHQTTVPQQALFLMNSPFVLEQAEHLARALGAVEAAKDPGARIRELYRRVYAREPDTEEAALGLRFVEEGAAGSPEGAWAEYAQAMMLGNEFAYVD
jgi:mono/diheme cytochrome c family protein